MYDPASSPTSPTPVNPPPRKRFRSKRFFAVAGTVAAGALIGGIVGSATGKTTIQVQRIAVPGPVSTKTVIQRVPVPGPTKTITKTVTVQAPPPPAGAKIGTWSGTGNQVTPAFNVPSSGDYIVKWSYSGNSDSYGGSNFAITENGSGLGGDLPNDIAASGQGSTEVTGAESTDSFNVEALGSWTITVISA
jgi:hypothetical protein